MASVRVLQAIGDYLSKQNLTSDNADFYISLAINRANEDLINFGHKYKDFEGMGTTVVLAMIFDDKIVFGSVGDSRGYIIDVNDLMIQVTTDHTWTNNLVAEGVLTQEKAATHAYRHHLTKAIGVSERIEPDTFTVNRGNVKWVLLCSDGLTEHLSNMEISSVMAKKAKPEFLIDYLISKANRKGGTDNITIACAKLIND